MTSKQVMLIVAATALCGCSLWERDEADPLVSPYPARRVLAVAPLGNESGSLHADGTVLADLLARHLENASNIDVLPVNRTLAAMHARGLGQLSSPAEAVQLLGTLGADGLIVGTVTSFDPYDPPKLGLAIELYVDPRLDRLPESMNIRAMFKAASGSSSSATSQRQRQPATVVSGYFDASSPEVRQAMRRYVDARGAGKRDDGILRNPFREEMNPQTLRLYRISMDLFSQFVSYEMSWRLLDTERRRLALLPTVQSAP